jgi:hypothetical protein
MQYFLSVLLFLEIIAHVLCGWNNPYFKSNCIPASDCSTENSCYCSNKFDGWMNGGFRRGGRRWPGDDDNAYCYKIDGNRDCECEDCGYWAIDSDQCQEKRCNDEYGIVESGKCYHIQPGTDNKVESSKEWQFNCYRSKVACDKTICNLGQHLTGCQRISPGTCTNCPVVADGYFLKTKGSCELTLCTSAGVGEFIAKACTSLRDAVVAHCNAHPGNRGYIVPRQDGKDTYYCPGGGLVLPLPENSQPTPDYSKFQCIDGYYLSGSSCLPCLPGSACKYGKKYTCPEHYYTSTFAMSRCTRCSTPDECHRISAYEHPLRCKQGSTANMGCVPCGGCSYDDRNGLSCVTESYEMQGLPANCEPMDVESNVAVCIQV